MIKREFKINFKSFLIWLAILIFMFLIVFLLYPYIITDETMQSIDEMMSIFPENVLKAFNMDMSSISTAYGWMKTEGFTFVLLIIGIYSSLLGSNILLKESDDKTIEYLGSLPLKRSKIVLSKLFVGIVYIVLMVLLLGIFNYLALIISGSLNIKEFILLSISPIFVGLPLFAINFFLSEFFHKSKKMLGISLGIVFISYIFSVISELSDKVSFIKYFSLYTLADTRGILANCHFNYLIIMISLIITLIFSFVSLYYFNKKELVNF